MDKMLGMKDKHKGSENIPATGHVSTLYISPGEIV